MPSPAANQEVVDSEKTHSEHPHPENTSGCEVIQDTNTKQTEVYGVAAATCEPAEPNAKNDKVPDETSVDTSPPVAEKEDVHDAKSSPAQEEGKNP